MNPAEARAARRQQQKAQAENGRVDFPPTWEADRLIASGNTIPLYAVTWWWTSKRGDRKITGNSYTSRRKAAAVAAQKQAEGTLAGTFTTYCAGFAL